MDKRHVKNTGLTRIAITMGDPAGIGPEVIVKGLAGLDLNKICIPLILGAPVAVTREIKRLKTDFPTAIIDSPLKIQEQKVNIFDCNANLDENDVTYGELSNRGAKAVVNWIKTAVELTKAGLIDAICTAPINKSVLQKRAGFQFPGHTEFLAHLTGSEDFVMMLAGQTLRVSLVTIHCPLSQVPDLITKQKIFSTIRTTHEALVKDIGLSMPRLAVSALNPHAGEGGRFGKEELEIISPAIEEARAGNINVEGPFPPDTVYYKAAKGQFDAVISMYHDQGLIPLKLLHFSDAVNITLGLPIIRTSVDHGTAYDIAGKGIADPKSFMQAVLLASLMAQNRKKQKNNS